MWQAVAAAVAGQVVSGMMNKGEKGGGGSGGSFITRKDPKQQAFENLQIAQRMAGDAQAALAGSERHPITGAPPSEIRAKAEYDRLVADALDKVGGPEELAKLLSRDSEVINAYGETKFV